MCVNIKTKPFNFYDDKKKSINSMSELDCDVTGANCIHYRQ